MKGARENSLEEKMAEILTDERVSALKSYLEKDHGIDCLLLLYMNKGRWAKAQGFVRGVLRRHIADGTFRSRVIELEMLKLARFENIRKNPLQKCYLITDSGRKITELLVSFLDQIQQEVVWC